MRSIALLCLAICLAFALPGHTAQPVSELRDIPLQWKPTKAISEYDSIDAHAFRRAHFVIQRFSDSRRQSDWIGVNVEKRLAERELPVSTSQNVPEWLTTRFRELFPQFGMQLEKKKGNFYVDATVLKFFVREGTSYEATVSLKVTVTAPNETVIWRGTTTGTATRNAPSYKSEYYCEALSNATTSAVHGLLSNYTFRMAIQRNW